jgi:hypothetical protein
LESYQPNGKRLSHQHAPQHRTKIARSLCRRGQSAFARRLYPLNQLKKEGIGDVVMLGFALILKSRQRSVLRA